MQKLNENIEDLFRRAAEHYPLNSDAANWDIIADRLKSHDAGIPLVNKSNSRSTYLLLVLLILVIPSVCFFYYKANNNQVLTNVEKHTPEFVQKKSAESGFENGKSQKSFSKIDFVAGGLADAELKNKKGNQKSDNNHLNSEDDISGKNLNASGIVAGQVIMQKMAVLANSSNITESVNLPELMVTDIGKQEVVKSDAEIFLNSETSAVSTEAAESVKTDKPEKAFESLKKLPIVLNRKEKGFYFGLTVGPQLSSVNLQNIQKPGLRYGIVGGYKLNETWGLELGILRSQQYYYTSANYFSSDGLKFRPTTTIKGIDGYNYITEFPLSVKYNFPISKKQHHFFLTGGISSQIVNSEKYWYQLNKDNRKDTTVLKLYDRYGKLQLFSGIQFTAGYEMPLFNHAVDFRIEPFVRIPVKGAGIGNVRVSTFGLNFGVTKKL